MPICKQCKLEKDYSEFYKHPKTKDWILHFCKECKKEYARNNRSKEQDKKRYWSNPRKRLNVIYRWMMSRCYNVNCRNYSRYWKRGIKVLWNNYKEFYDDMISSYIIHWEQNWKTKNRQTQIDRINNNWHYCKENCKRVNAKENNQHNKF